MLGDIVAIGETVSLARSADPHSPYAQKTKSTQAGDPNTNATRYAEASGDDSDRASTTHLVIIDKMGRHRLLHAVAGTAFWFAGGGHPAPGSC